MLLIRLSLSGQMNKAGKKSSGYNLAYKSRNTAYVRKKHTLGKSLGSSAQLEVPKNGAELEFLKNAAEKTRHSIESAIASMKTLPAHDNRDALPLRHMQEYHKSITTLADNIRFGWNTAITAYIEAAGAAAAPTASLEPASRSPSPSQSFSTSNLNTEASPSPPTRGYRLSYSSSDSVEF